MGKTAEHVGNQDGGIIFFVHPEVFRLFGFLILYVNLAVSAILTFLFAAQHVHENPIIEFFGAYNLCILLDHPPANYVSPILWAVSMMCFVVYFLLNEFQLHQMLNLDLITRASFYIRSSILGLAMLLTITFTVSFAVSPYENIVVHTLPFMGFIVALAILTFSNSLFYGKIVKYAKWEKIYLAAFNTVLSLVLGLYFLLMLNAVGNFSWPWVYTMNYQLVDIVASSMLLVFPAAHAFYGIKRVAHNKVKCVFSYGQLGSN